CPAAAARLDARTLLGYVTRSCVYGLFAGVTGYLLATRTAPAVLGSSIDASGTVAVCAGTLLAVRALVVRRS
ncbi:MAG: metal ABC transporter permease, partial [Planctomycetota bacterium]|nr:metal ABC transporter permease [Planctomycetota bacterium]